MLLQALDLLDRGLVTRVVLRDLTAPSENTGERVVPPQVHVHLASSHPEIETRGERSGNKRKRNAVYLVRSSQPQKSRFNASPSASAPGTIYTVRLEAWDCSCAAFAFSAFPGGSSGSTWKMGDEGEDESDGEVRGKGEWEFGGLCSDGEEGGSVPTCKHLLACLLGERWEGMLGGYVKERTVGREEMAGFGGEG
jgi:hypothetical protein